jgi:hypothetical protein
MNRQDELKRAAQGVVDAAPAALKALRGAIERLNAPFHVRAWHQMMGDEGWGDGTEYHICVIVAVCAAALGLLALL